MICLYSGTPGSGKSLHLAELLYWRNRRKCPIICNFDFKTNNPNFYCMDNDEITPQFLTKFALDYFENHKFKEGTITLVIDECQIMFNSRSWADKDRAGWLKFFTQHRKLGYEVILVAQFDLMIDKQIRSLIEYQYIHRKVSNFGIMGFLMSSFCLGKLFVSVKVWYPLKERVGSEFFICKKKYYSLYDTVQLFDKSNFQ